VFSWLSYQWKVLQILELMLLESMFFYLTFMPMKGCGMMLSKWFYDILLGIATRVVRGGSLI
jgi:hypothetical protein